MAPCVGGDPALLIPGNPLAGLLLDRWGRRRLFILGMLLGVLSTASYGLVRGFWPFLAGRLAWGIAWTLINVGGMAIVILTMFIVPTLYCAVEEWKLRLGIRDPRFAAHPEATAPGP